LTERERADALDALTRSPGWGLFLEMLERREQVAIDSLVKTTPDVSPIWASVYAGQARMLREIKIWPVREATATYEKLTEQGAGDGN